MGHSEKRSPLFGTIVYAMPAVDTPDRAALAENPLAVPGLKLG